MSDTIPVPHRRQFLIGRQPRDGWLQLALPDGLWLSYEAALPVEVTEDEILLGVRTPSGGGRYVTIRWPYLYPDCAALLAVYYKDGAASSSQWLLSGASAETPKKARLNYFPVPGSGRDGVSTLLRDQRLNLVTMAVEPVARVLEPLASTAAARDALAEALVTECRELAQRNDRVLLGMTAGLDSRTIMAALLAAGVKFQTITQTFPGVNGDDVRGARALSRKAGVKHQLIEPQPFDQGRSDAWREHTSGVVNDTDANWFPLGLWRFLRAGDLFLKGGCFEVGRRFYEIDFGDLTFDTATSDVLVSALGASHGGPALERWLAWRREHPSGLDLVDSFYLDQRLGGWRAATEQAKDALQGEFIHPANTEIVYRALITPDPAARKAGQLQRDVIKVLAPRLLDLPFNTGSLPRRIVRDVRARLAGLRTSAS